MLAHEIGNIASSAVAGIVAAIVATVILGGAKYIYGKHLQHLDVRQIREILTTGRERVMTSTDTRHEGLDTTLPADTLRCAQYNLMIKQLAAALDHTTTKLPYSKRKQIIEALDWYHVTSLHATKNRKGRPVFVIPPEGTWPTTEMKRHHAIDKFNKLEAIKWLKLGSYRPSSPPSRSLT